MKAERGSDTPWAPEWHKGAAGLSYAFIEKNQLHKKEGWPTWSGQNDGDAAAATGMGPGEQARSKTFSLMQEPDGSSWCRGTL